MTEFSLNQIAETHWTKSARVTEALAGRVREHLKTLAPGETLGTTALLRTLGATTGQITALASHLGNARNDGLLTQYFERGKKGAFGKESVVWHRRRELTTEERRAIVARDMAEEDAQLAARKKANEEDEAEIERRCNDPNEDWSA